jgi:PAS domain S-box-containing protein
MTEERQKLILLVEDEAIVAMAEKRSLEQYGYEVISAHCGERAVDLVNERSDIDLILMDIDLGKGIDGTEAAEQILERHELPVVFLSSHTDPEVVEKTEKITSYGYVVKNSSLTVLDASIKMAFKLFAANRRILESELKQKTMLANISDVLVIIDKDGINRYKSPNITRWFGWKPEELVGRITWELVHPEDLEAARKLLDTLGRTPGAAGTAELRYRCRNGSYTWIEITLVNLLNDPIIEGFLGNYHDIAGRKEIEREKFALAALTENSDDLCVVKGLDRRIISANAKFIAAAGCDSLAPLLGKTDAEILGIPETEEPARSYMLADIEVLDLGPGESRLWEEKVPFVESGLRTTLTRKFPIFAAGELLGLGVITSDITEYRQTEHELLIRDEDLRREHLRLSGIIEGTNVGTWEWNVQTGESIFNERWAEIVGYSLAELSPVSIDTWKNFAHPEDLKKSTSLIESHFRGELPYYEFEARVRHRDGGWRWVLDRGKLVSRTEDGKPLMMMGTHQDITARKESEKQIQALLSEKDLILKEVHHRIKNNMYVLRSMLQLQAESMDCPSSSAALKDAVGRIHSMAALYDRLYLSQNGGHICVSEYLSSLVDEIIAIFPWSLQVTVEKKIDNFRLDSRRLQVLGILVNELLTNSLKYAFTGRDSGTITVNASCADGSVSVAVEDDGTGIPDSFDFETSKGLGMTIVRELAGQLDGTISIERVEGTRALLVFPV